MFLFSGTPAQGGAFQGKGGITSANAKEALLGDIVREVKPDIVKEVKLTPIRYSDSKMLSAAPLTQNIFSAGHPPAPFSKFKMNLVKHFFGV